MPDINQNVNINVNANTQDASRDVERLENNIKTLDGAINLVGGTIEVLAGALVLSGAASEEQAQKFESAAVGAIALADGSKRIIEGYKTLATETKVLTVIQRIYNTVMKANPLFIIVGVIAAVTLGVIALTKALKNQAEEQQRLNDLQSSDRLQGFLERQIKLAKARGAETKDILTLEVQLAKEREEAAFKAIKEAEDENEARQKYLNLLTDRQIAEINLEKEQKRIAEETAVRTDMERTRAQGTLDLKKKEIDFNAEVADSGLKLIDTKQALAATEVQIEQVKSDKIRAINQSEQEYKEKLLTEGVDNIQASLSALFGESKAVASANVLIDAAQAGVAIIKNSQSTGPLAIAYQATQFALLGATTAAALRDINSAEPGSSNAPSTPRGGTPSFQQGTSVIGGATGTIAPSLSSAPPVRAYVVTGDVRDGLEAETLLQTRRQFP